jgi:uncharacterized protein (DUF2267 family)
LSRSHLTKIVEVPKPGTSPIFFSGEIYFDNKRVIKMEYREILDEIKKCDFIPDDETAAAAEKAVLGILASSLEEEEARNLTRYLPEPLTLERLRGHQERRLDITLPQFVAVMGEQLNLSEREACLLILTVLNTVKASVDDDLLRSHIDEIANEVKQIRKSV